MIDPAASRTSAGAAPAPAAAAAPAAPAAPAAKCGMVAVEIVTAWAVRLRDLAAAARRLPPPDHRNPHAFHEARDELGAAIAAVAAAPERSRHARPSDSGSEHARGGRAEDHRFRRREPPHARRGG